MRPFDGITLHYQLHVLIGVDLHTCALTGENGRAGRAGNDKNDKEKALFHKSFQGVMVDLINPAG